MRAWPLVGWEASSPDNGEGQKLGEGVRGGVTREIYLLSLSCGFHGASEPGGES